jgi:hypothetical protein
MASDDKPTAKQLRCLRTLCEATGETTSWPKTRQEAPRAFERLKTRPRSDAEERWRDRREVKGPAGARETSVSRLRGDEADAVRALRPAAHAVGRPGSRLRPPTRRGRLCIRVGAAL